MGLSCSQGTNGAGCQSSCINTSKKCPEELSHTPHERFRQGLERDENPHDIRVWLLAQGCSPADIDEGYIRCTRFECKEYIMERLREAYVNGQKPEDVKWWKTWCLADDMMTEREYSLRFTEIWREFDASGLQMLQMQKKSRGCLIKKPDLSEQELLQWIYEQHMQGFEDIVIYESLCSQDLPQTLIDEAMRNFPESNFGRKLERFARGVGEEIVKGIGMGESPQQIKARLKKDWHATDKLITYLFKMAKDMHPDVMRNVDAML